jgi:hypothetical protein
MTTGEGRSERWWGVETVVFLALFLALAAIGPTTLFRDPGTFWHQRAGEEMLAGGRAITTDSFSYGFRGQPWLAHAWLAECVQALLTRIGGFDTLLVTAAASIAAFYAWSARRLAAAGLQAPVVVLVVILAVAASSYQFLARPLLLSIFAMGWIAARLGDVEEGRLAPLRLLGLLPLLVVWTNVHGAVLGGLVTIAMALVGWTVVALVGPRVPGSPEWPTPVRDLRSLAFLVLFGLLCAATIFVNPYGAALLGQWTAVVDSPVIARLMVEHAPLRLSDPASVAVLVFAALYVAALIGVPWRKWRVTWLLPLVWLAMASSRIRHGPLFASMAVVALGAMLPHVRWIAWLARHGSELLQLRAEPPLPARRAAALPAALVALALGLQAGGVPAPWIGRGAMQLDADYWPTAMLPDLEDFARSHPPGTPVFNEMLYGGFLIHFAPSLGVFIDDRCELYGDRRLREYEEALLGDKDRIAEWVGADDVAIALVVAGSPFDHFLRASPDWRIVRETKSATLLRKRDAVAP